MNELVAVHKTVCSVCGHPMSSGDMNRLLKHIFAHVDASKARVIECPIGRIGTEKEPAI